MSRRPLATKDANQPPPRKMRIVEKSPNTAKSKSKKVQPPPMTLSFPPPTPEQLLLKEREEQTAEMRRRLIERRERNDRLREDLFQLQNQMQDIRVEGEKKSQTVTEQKTAKLREIEATSRSLKEQIEGQSQSLAKATERQEEAQTVLGVVYGELQELCRSNGDLEKDCQSLLTSATDLERKTKETREKIDQLQLQRKNQLMDIEGLRRAADHAENERKAAAKEYHGRQAVLVDLQQKIDQLKERQRNARNAY